MCLPLLLCVTLTGQSTISILYLSPHFLPSLLPQSYIILCSDSLKTLDGMVCGNHVEDWMDACIVEQL